jgi:transposase
LIEAWVSQQLIHALRPGQAVILDNASFHHKARLEEILAQAGCFLLPLPRYSPDLNDIEPLWNSLKAKIAHTRHRYPDFQTAVDAAFL